jgi:four helix bundle protein
MAYQLEERTLLFSKNIIDLCKSLKNNTVNYKLIDQLVRSATSVGSNYREANETDTKKDFRNRVRIAKKEAKETIYWLTLIEHSNTERVDDISPLISEANELMKILASIYQKCSC